MFIISRRISKSRQKVYKRETYFLACKTLKCFLTSFQMNYYFMYNYMVNYFRHESAMRLTRIRNTCVLTGRSRSVYRMFKLSRLKIREYASLGYFIGLTKSSW